MCVKSLTKRWLCHDSTEKKFRMLVSSNTSETQRKFNSQVRSWKRFYSIRYNCWWRLTINSQRVRQCLISYVGWEEYNQLRRRTSSVYDCLVGAARRNTDECWLISLDIRQCCFERQCRRTIWMNDCTQIVLKRGRYV